MEKMQTFFRVPGTNGDDVRNPSQNQRVSIKFWTY